MLFEFRLFRSTDIFETRPREAKKRKSHGLHRLHLHLHLCLSLAVEVSESRPFSSNFV